MTMKRTLLVLLWSVLIVQLKAQTVMGRQNVDSFPVYDWSVYPTSGLNYGLTYLPPDYAANPTKKFPLIIFLHGVGQSVTTTSPTASMLSSLIQSGTGLTGVIAGGFSPSAVNPVDGQTYEFIVVSPQNASGWSDNYDQLKYILPNVLSRYHVDLNRIYLTGLSAGGDGTWTVMGSGDAAFIKQFAAIATASSAQADGVNGLSQPQVESNLAQTGGVYGIPAWAVAGDQDGLTVNSENYINSINSYSPAPAIKAKFTLLAGVGHSAWNQLYDPNWRPNINYYGTNCASTAEMANGNDGVGKGTGKTPDSLNVYEWFLLYSKGAAATPPAVVANAGTAQTITLPTSSVTLSGTGSTGTITSYAWTKVSGGAATITTPSGSSTTVTGLAAGTYTFQLSVNGGASTSTVTVTVNAAPATVTASAGTNQSITLPTSSVTLSGTGSTGTITSYIWTEVSGPSASIATPANATTSVTGLTAGSYVFQLSVNGGVSTSTVTITVTGASAPSTPSACNGHKYTLTQNADSAIWEFPTHYTYNYLPGDTIVVPHNPNANNYWAWVTFNGINGTSACPIVVINDNVGQTLVKGQVQFDGCTYMKFTGTGQTGQPYGFKLEYDPVLRYQEKGGIYVLDKSKDIEISNILIHNVGTGIAILTDNNCDQSYDYPNWVLDSMSIHDNKIVGVWNEGMYLGNTSPDNNYYDARPDQCAVAQSTPTYSIPAKTGYTHVYNNIVDSTGRGGIQLANAGGTAAVSEINNNVCTHNGLNQDDAQGTSISIGLYTKAYIHDNTCRNTYTWAIASLGGGATNVPVRMENNHVDSSGYLRGWFRLSTTGDQVFNPATEPVFADTLTWPYPFEVDTKPKNFTQASGGTYNPGPGAPYGTAVQGQDSTEFWIKNNVIGLFKGGAPGGSQPQAIQVHDYDTSIQKNGNIICNNTSSIGQTITVQAYDNNGHVLTYVNTCTANVPPTVNAGANQTITLPTSTVALAGTVTPNNGATISSTVWTQFSGPTTATIGTPNAIATTITNLSAGTYIFQLTATDNNGLTGSATVTITVNPAVTNTPPTVSAGSNQTITLPVSTVTLTGTASGNNGATISSYTWTQVSGAAASITSPANVSTSVTGLTQGVYVFQLTAKDNNGLTASATVTITVNAPAPPVPPTVSAGSNQTITLPTNVVTLTGSATGANGATISSYAWTEVSGGAATISSPSSPTTAITGLVQGVYTFQLKATDNNGQSATSTVTVTVNAAAPNTPPTVSAGANQTITLPTDVATLSGTASGTNGATITSYAWTEVSGGVAVISSPSSPSTAITGLVQGVYTFQLKVTDNNGLSATSTVTVTVNAAANVPPVANAGPNQTIVLPTNSVTLNGSGTDADGTVVSYAWSQVSGPSASTIVTASQPTTQFTNLIQGVYVFRLTVTDNDGATGYSNVTVIVNAANNQPPVANAGSNQTITLPTNSVTLTGSGTDPDGTVASYAWTQVSGPSAGAITTPGGATTTVTGLVQGVYVFQLLVTDNQGANDAATVTVTVNAAANVAPTANAGSNQTITLPTNSTTLTGSGTGANGAVIVSYSWTQVSGGAATIVSPSSSSTGISGLAQGTYVFQLTVTDNHGLTGTSTVTVTVNAAVNVAPTANAGANQTITLPTNSTTLTGSGTGANGAVIVSYSWTEISGGSVTIVSPASSSTGLSGLGLGTYVFQLTVTDNNGLTGTSQVTVTVNPNPTPPPANKPPVANAGPDQNLTAPVAQGSLDGTASYDPDGTIVAWSWVQISGPGGVTIAGSTTSTPTLYGLQPGTYVFQLTVTDNDGATASDDVTITVVAGTANSTTLFANAGTDTVIALPADIAVLNGSASYSTNSTIVSYSWSQVSGPDGAVINTPLGVSSTVSPLVLGDYTFKLTVMDAIGNMASDTVHVSVINTLRTDKNLAILYPNPVSGNAVTLDLLNSNTGKMIVTISEVGGHQVQEFVFDKENDEFKQLLTLQPLARGVYFVRVVFNNGQRPIVLRMVKQ